MFREKIGLAVWGLVLGCDLDTAGVDPLALEVGTPFTVAVQLDRQGAALSLSDLATTILFDDVSHFSGPTAVAAGSIVPLDTDLMFTSSFPGSFDAQYSNFFLGPPGIGYESDSYENRCA